MPFSNLSPELIDATLEGIKKGDIWLNKIRYDAEGNRIYGNVCLEVYLPSRGTCLLQHINLGACRLEDLTPAFVEGMTSLVNLHAKTGVGETGEYLDPEVDKQVGLGVLGLANFLCQNNVTYKQFGEALDAYHSHQPTHTPAYILVSQLAKSIEIAAQIARQAGMQRAFAIAPTASCSYNNIDLRGYTTTPELAPPISRHVDRDSGTFGVQSFAYPPDCEIASEVGWHDYKKVDARKSDVWVEDASTATIILQLAAESIGLGSCWIQIRDRPHSKERTAQEYVADLLHLPAGVLVEAMVAVGYPAESTSPHPREKLGWSQVHTEVFGRPNREHPAAERTGTETR